MGSIRVLLVLCALAGHAGADAKPQELRVSAIPDESAEQLARKFAPLGAYLSKALGIPVTFMPAPDYAATVENLATRKIDLVWYGGFTYVQARRRTGDARVVVQREEDSKFHTKIIVPASSRAKTLADLKGKVFSFGSISSTSGHLMPRYFLMKAGIDPDKDFAKVSYSGAHDATVQLVASGKVDAGAVNESVLAKLIEEHRVDPNKIRVLYTTPNYVDYTWTVRGDLDPKFVERLRDAFLALDYSKPEHRVILDLQRTKRFVRTDADDYKATEHAAKAAHLIHD